MIGNGPYAMESARTDEEIVLVRNDEWSGDYNGRHLGRPPRAHHLPGDRRPRHLVQLVRGRGGRQRQHPAGPERPRPQENYGTTLDVAILGSYHYDFNDRSPLVGGEENLLFRQAISQAIDREEINQAVYDGSRTTATGVTPRGIPGFAEGICDYCAYDAEAAQAVVRRVDRSGQRAERAPADPVQP